jgi:hypothetical protein
LDGHGDNAVFRFQTHVDEHHPAPWSEHEPEAAPASFKGRTHERKTLERVQRPRDAAASVCREAERSDHRADLIVRALEIGPAD